MLKNVLKISSMTKLIYLLNSQQSFVDIFIENLKNNAIPVLLVGPILLAIVFIIYGVKSDWFAKLFGSGRSVSRSRVALADYLSRIETLMYEGEDPLSLTEPLDKKDGAVSPASVIECSIQTLRNFNDPQGIKNWRELYQADIIVTESILDRVLQFEILLRLLQYGNDRTSIINCMKSVNEFWLLITQGKVREEDGQMVTLFPEEKVGYGVTAVKKAERPMFYIKPALSEHPAFEKFLKKLQHGMTHTEMTPQQIENILKESNMADTPIIFRGARQILADRWMELFDVSMKEIHMPTISHETLWDMYQDVVKMKTTVDVYPELVDISSNLEIQKNNLTELWRVKYSAYWYKRLVDIDRYNDNEVLGSLSQAIEQILVDEKKYLFNKNIFSETFIDCLKLAFEISEKSDNYQFLKKVQDWFEEHDSVDRFGYKAKLQERFDSFVQNVPVPARNKLKAVKQA